MKPFKNMIILSAIVCGIVLFWLVPGINKAKDVQYTRFYEDTNKKHNILEDSTKGQNNKKSTVLRTKKIYKKESIYSNSKLTDIKPYMFSRSAQFTQQVKVIELDSLDNVVQVSSIDTVAQLQVSKFEPASK